DASREALLTALGACAIGAVFVPLNTRSSDDELDHAFGLLQPRLIVCLEASLERLQRLTSASCVVLDNGRPGSRWPEPHDSDAVLPDRVTAAVRPDDLGCLLFTSGTTARSKAAMHTQQSMIGAGFAMGSAVGLGENDL